jgi:lipid II:glycine glycyltransferase (peptidoglycan interpeptide bridge formation enzyme)
LLHWEDILYFKANGFKVYDLGGVSMDTTNQDRQAINKFKECFGGILVKEYNSLIPVSPKGYLYVLYQIAKQKLNHT